MARRYFNWTLAIVLVVAVVVFTGAVLALHRWQRNIKNIKAERALPLAEQAYAQENWDEAAVQFSRYLGVRNDEIPILLKYADAQLRRRPIARDNIQQAVGVYQAILRLDGGNLEASKRLVEYYLTAASPAEVGQIMSQYVQNKDEPDLRRMLALALIQQRKYPEATKTLLDLIKNHPDDVLSYETLGWLAQERPTDVNGPAADWFDKAVMANPQSAMAYIIRGVFHRQQGRREQALADFEQAAKCDLSSVDVHLRLAQELIRTNAVDKAKEHLTAMQAKSPKEVSLWQTWAAAVLLSGSAQEKATVAETGLKELAAYPWDFIPTAAELFIAANQPEKAQDCIAQMGKRGLSPGVIAFLNGLVAGAKGNLWETVQRWQDALAQGHTLHAYADELRRSRWPFWILLRHTLRAYAGGPGPVVPVRLMLASSYAQLGDVQSAKGQLQTLVSENPTYIEGRLALARLMARQRDWTGALAQAREAQRLVPGYPEAVLLELQANIFLLDPTDSSARQRTWQEIEKRLADADKATSGAVQVKLLWAQALGRQGKFAEAAKLLEEAKSKDPLDIRPILLEAEFLVAQNKPDEAMTVLRGAIEKFPQEVELVQSLALMLNRQKDLQQCESVLKEAIARLQAPESRRSLGLLLADLYRFWTREDELYKWLMEMDGQDPNDIQIKRRLLTCPQVTKDVPGAQKLVAKIKSLEGPTGWQWRYEQAKVWVNSEGFKGHYTEASTYLQENLLSNPDDQASRLLLAAAHEKAGQKQLALSTYREAYKRSPNNIEIIMQMVAALYRNSTAYESPEAKEARDIVKRAGERQLYHPDLDKLNLYGQRMLWQDQVRRGDLDSAWDNLQKFVQSDPNDVSASLLLSQVAMRQGRLDEADVLLKALETRLPQSPSVIQTRIQLCVLQGNAKEALRLCDETVQKKDQAAAYLLRAWTYASLRENDKAIEDFGRAVAKDPGKAAVLMERASFYQSLGRREEAIQDVREVLRLSAGAQPVLERAIPLCLASGSRRLVEEAEAALDKALGDDGNNASLKIIKAQFLLNRGTKSAIEQAQGLLREVTGSQPEKAQAWYLLGNLELRQKEWGRALEIAISGLSHNEGDRQLLLLKAEAEAARSPASAVVTLSSLREQYPNDIEVEMRLASALYRRGEKSEGRSLLDDRMKAEPNNPAPVVTLATLLASEERWTDVTEQVTKWVAKHPDDNVVAATVARSLMMIGSAKALEAAESLLKAAVERNPKSVAAIGSLAMLMQQAGRTEEAVTLNRKVLGLDPNDIIALNNLAWMLCEDNKEYQKALELAEEGLKVAPDYADLLDTRGVALYRLGQIEQIKNAAEDFAKCIELYPPKARSLPAAYFHLGRAHAKLLGHVDQARRYLSEAIDRHKADGGLSPADLAEANLLLEQLPKDR